MLSLVLRPLRNTASVLLANDSSGQIAAGATIGMLLGLVPKGNLIAIGLCFLLMALRVNRTAGLLAAGLFSWVGVAVDPFTHRLGAQLLTIDSLQPIYVWLYDLPLGPWVGFNNTVALGSLAVGLYLAYPCWYLTLVTADRYRAPVAAWLLRRRVTRWLFGAEIASRWALPLDLGSTRMGAGS